MSTTPRTDEQTLAYRTEDGSEMVHASFARQLETELAAAKLEADGETRWASEYLARAEKAEADTARLDWLSVSDVWLDVPATEAFTPETIRAAIDLAMKEASK